MSSWSARRDLIHHGAAAIQAAGDDCKGKHANAVVTGDFLHSVRNHGVRLTSMVAEGPVGASMRSTPSFSHIHRAIPSEFATTVSWLLRGCGRSGAIVKSLPFHLRHGRIGPSLSATGRVQSPGSRQSIVNYGAGGKCNFHRPGSNPSTPSVQTS